MEVRRRRLGMTGGRVNLLLKLLSQNLVQILFLLHFLLNQIMILMVEVNLMVPNY